MYLSVVIPAYKEAERIPKTLDKVKEFLSEQSYDWEVIVVNDGSPDKTAEVVSEKIKGWNTATGQFHLIDNKVNKGKGGVVKQGLAAAKGDWRLVMDADSSTDIKEVDKLLPFTNEFECIIGSRYLKKDSIKVK